MEVFNQSAEKNEEESQLQNSNELDIIKPEVNIITGRLWHSMEIKTNEIDKQMLDKKNILQILNTYREDMFKKFNEIDSNVDGNFTFYKTQIEKKIDSFEKLINLQNLKINEVIQNYISDRNKIDKVNDLLTFKSDIDNILFDVNKKIPGIATDMKLYKDKFEAIVLENLYVPGLIGAGKCKFRNLKEYIEVCC